MAFMPFCLSIITILLDSLLVLPYKKGYFDYFRFSLQVTMQKPPRTFCRPGRFLPFGRNALQQRVQHKPRRARARHHKDGVLLPAPQHEQRGGKQQHGNEVHIREPCGQRVRTEK